MTAAGGRLVERRLSALGSEEAGSSNLFKNFCIVTSLPSYARKISMLANDDPVI